MGYKIFLDDIRVPTDVYPKTNNESWVIIRNLTDFKKTIEEKGAPSFISFDNDLGENLEEGKDAVKWLVFDKEADIRNMDFKVHSANSSGVREYMIGTLNNWKKHLSEQQDSLNEGFRNKISGIILEYLQAAQKVYFNTGKLNKNDEDIILSITNGDNYTKIISDIFYEFTKSRYKGKNNVSLGKVDIELIKSYYEQLKSYNKNVFPIKGLNITGVKNTNELIGSLNERGKILEEMKKLPSVAIRNLKNDIRKERSYDELRSYQHDLNYFVGHLSLLDNRDEKMKDAVLRKMFKSYTTIEDLSAFIQEKESLLGGLSFTKNKVKDICDEYYSGCRIVYDKENIMVVEIDEPRGMARIGCNSLWCFSYGKGNNWNQFNSYSTNGIVYVIIDFNYKPDTLDFMHVLIKPVDWDGSGFDDDNDRSSALYSMDNEPVSSPEHYLIDWVGSEEKAKEIFNFYEEYISKEEKEKQEKEKQQDLISLKINIEEFFNEFYGSADVPFPDFNEFYEKYLEKYPDNDSIDSDEVKKLVAQVLSDKKTNPKQMSLFETMLRHKIRNFIFENEEDLLPEELIDTFANRIKKLFNSGATKDHPSIEKELNRIRSINGDKIPQKILELLK